MQTWHGLDEIRSDFGSTVVTIGNFDGVHVGHVHVVARAIEVAAAHGGLPVVAVTFDPHPMSVIAPDHAPTMLVSLDERLRLLDEAGVGVVLVLPFTEDLAKVSATDFVTDILFDRLHAAAVVVGENFRFGHRATGNIKLLRELAADHGVDVHGLSLDGAGDVVWSSTYVRGRLADGDVEAAANALGRPFSVRGEVVKGHQRGRELLGYPTANVPVRSTATAVPADGVYAGWLRRLDAASEGYQPAAISVGTNPTFDGLERTVEAYVLDRDDLELYGVPVEIVFAERLRSMEKYEDIEALIRQMDTDVDRTRELLTSKAPPDPP